MSEDIKEELKDAGKKILSFLNENKFSKPFLFIYGLALGYILGLL